ncbi:hypothetical protein [Limnofasciculus baicalensis]|uniref:Uncharacterized protein n=1 Tax=Limnofasciculus baicalensis BBK-W-15 TaxID=2699891 RepID=A0AAE3GVQ0_9CYAN|nr:hypothetical protein [Limnofasciculus baicalensis]MCP2730932.1 hypothetical protein [Limnofasciculus baicalensis BBK-W-15]
MSLIRDLATSVFSYMYACRLKKQHLYKSRKDQIRNNVVDFEIAENVGLEVYWKTLKVAEGPSLIFHALGYEILRFDTNIGEQAHCHIQLIECQPKCKERLFLPEKTVEEQIERAIFELEKNLDYWLQRHPDRQVRLLKIDQTKLKIATEKAREKMLEYAQKIKVGSASTETVG